MRHGLGLALSLLLATGALAQSDPASTSQTRQKSGSRSVSADINELKDAIAAQQEQIKQLQQQIQSRDAAIQSLQSQIKNIPAPAPPPPPGPDYSGDISTLQHDVTDLKATNANTVEALTETQKRIGDLESPLAIHYKGVTLTPGGFMAAETVWRSHATLGDINTPMNNIPFSAAGQAHQSEFYGSGRQSRISMLMQGKGSWGTYAGYYEMDFLSAGVTSNNNQSNSYTMRQRQAFAQAALNNGWTFTGGQMWSLVMETRKGLDPRTEALPMQIDAQYVAGMSWARQYGFRVTKNFHNKIWAGFSVEDSQTTVATRGGFNNFLIGGPGNAAGLYNSAVTFNGYTSFDTAISCPAAVPADITKLPKGCVVVSTPTGTTTVLQVPPTGAIVNGSTVNYASNVSPDLIAKVAFEPGFGHYEVFAIGSAFRERVYPNVVNPAATTATLQAAGAYNRTSWNGGIGANARWMFAKKKVETGVHFLGGNAVGRYGNSGLPDMTVYGTGIEHPLRSYQALVSLEYHLPKWDFYGYGGGDYAGKNWSPYVNPFNGAKTVAVGYGSPFFNNTGCGTETPPASGNGFGPGSLSGCAGDTQSVIEGTTGFWYKPYNGPRGRIQIGLQYSYLSRNAWAGYNSPSTWTFPYPYPSATTNPKGIENMWFTSFRYYLP